MSQRKLLAHLKRAWRSKENGDIVFSFGGIGATPYNYTQQCSTDVEVDND